MSQQNAQSVPRTLTNVERVGNKFELCVCVHLNDTRESHEDFYLTVEELIDLRNAINEALHPDQ